MKDYHGSKFYVVDVCGTLVRDDTTLGLLRHHFRRTGSRLGRAWLFDAMTHRRSPVWFGFAVAEKLSRRHLLKHCAARLLAGDTVESLRVSAEEYADWLLSERRVSAVWQRLDQLQVNGRVVLASASLAPVVGALANAMEVDYVASALEEKDGHLTGRYAQDLTGRKEEALVEKYGESFLDGADYVLTDNLTDRDLVKKAKRACVILHHPSHRERWGDVNAEFVGVDQ